VQKYDLFFVFAKLSQKNSEKIENLPVLWYANRYLGRIVESIYIVKQ